VTTDSTDMTRGTYRRIYGGYITGRRINAVSLHAEAWFWRINAIADDFGNTLADLTLLRNATVGRRGDVTVQDVEGWVEELIDARLITLYEVEDEQYLHVNDFTERQPAGKNGKRVQRHPKPPECFRREDGQGQGNPGESQSIPAEPSAASATHTHTHNHNHNHTHTQEEPSVGESKEPPRDKSSATHADKLSRAQTFAKNWITANCTQHMKPSRIASFVNLIMRVGKEEAVQRVLPYVNDTTKTNPFAYVDAIPENAREPTSGGPHAERASVTEMVVLGET
jgi:hypothetical protein